MPKFVLVPATDSIAFPLLNRTARKSSVALRQPGRSFRAFYITGQVLQGEMVRSHLRAGLSEKEHPMGRVCKGTGGKEGHIGARYSIHTIRRQENHLAIKYLALLCVCMLQGIQCAKLLF